MSLADCDSLMNGHAASINARVKAWRSLKYDAHGTMIRTSM